MDAATLVLPLLIIGACLGGYILLYNGLARAVTVVEQGWAGIEVQLKRRHDLAPQLVKAVKAALRHDNEIFDRVLASREKAMATLNTHDPALISATEAEFSQAVSRLIGFTEDNPEITATGNIANFQKQVEETEDQIAASRRLYNGNVQALNARIVTFPGNLVASAHQFQKAVFFELDPQERSAALATPDHDL